MQPKVPQDYSLFGFTYDGKVLAAPAWYLVAQEADPLVRGLNGESERAIEEEFEWLGAIFRARAQGIHQPVRWAGVDRLVCVCGLVVRSLQRWIDPLGHLDPVTWKPADVVVVRMSEFEPKFLAACQTCGEQFRATSLEAARAWSHSCGPAPDPSGELDFRNVETHPDEPFDDLVHRVRSRSLHGDRGDTGVQRHHTYISVRSTTEWVLAGYAVCEECGDLSEGMPLDTEDVAVRQIAAEHWANAPLDPGPAD